MTCGATVVGLPRSGTSLSIYSEDSCRIVHTPFLFLSLSCRRFSPGHVIQPTFTSISKSSMTIFLILVRQRRPRGSFILWPDVVSPVLLRQRPHTHPRRQPTHPSTHTSFRKLSQLLVTEFDYRTPERRRNLRYTTSTMLKLGVVPILNENDAVSGNEGYEADGMFSDNDGLAALVAEQVRREKKKKKRRGRNRKG